MYYPRGRGNGGNDWHGQSFNHVAVSHRGRQLQNYPGGNGISAAPPAVTEVVEGRGHGQPQNIRGNVIPAAPSAMTNRVGGRWPGQSQYGRGNVIPEAPPAVTEVIGGRGHGQPQYSRGNVIPVAPSAVTSGVGRWPGQPQYSRGNVTPVAPSTVTSGVGRWPGQPQYSRGNVIPKAPRAVKEVVRGRGAGQPQNIRGNVIPEAPPAVTEVVRERGHGQSQNIRGNVIPEAPPAVTEVVRERGHGQSQNIRGNVIPAVPSAAAVTGGVGRWPGQPQYSRGNVIPVAPPAVTGVVRGWPGQPQNIQAHVRPAPYDPMPYYGTRAQYQYNGTTYYYDTQPPIMYAQPQAPPQFQNFYGYQVNPDEFLTPVIYNNDNHYHNPSPAGHLNDYFNPALLAGVLTVYNLYMMRLAMRSQWQVLPNRTILWVQQQNEMKDNDPTYEQPSTVIDGPLSEVLQGEVVNMWRPPEQDPALPEANDQLRRFPRIRQIYKKLE